MVFAFNLNVYFEENDANGHNFCSELCRKRPVNGRLPLRTVPNIQGQLGNWRKRSVHAMPQRAVCPLSDAYPIIRKQFARVSLKEENLQWTTERANDRRIYTNLFFCGDSHWNMKMLPNYEASLCLHDQSVLCCEFWEFAVRSSIARLK